MSLLNQVLRDLDSRQGEQHRQELHLVSSGHRATPPHTVEKGRDWVRLGSWILVLCALLLWLGVWFFLDPPEKAPQSRYADLRSGTVSGQPAGQPPTVVLETQAPVAPEWKQQPGVFQPQPVNPTPSKPQTSKPEPIEAIGQVADDEVKLAPAARHPDTSDQQPPPVANNQVEPRRIAKVVPASAPEQSANPAPEDPQVRTDPAPSKLGPQKLSPRKFSPRKPVSQRSVSKQSVNAQKTVSSTAAARQLIAKGELAQAEQVLRDYLQREPTATIAHELLVGLLVRGNRHEEAFEQVAIAQRESGYNHVLELIAARLMFDLGDADGAEQRLVTLLERYPDNAKARRLLAAHWYAEGRRDQARLAYRQLARRADSSARDWLGLALSLDGDHPASALRAYRQAAIRNGFSPDTENYIHQRIADLQSDSKRPTQEER